jgi:hypothetical protein
MPPVWLVFVAGSPAGTTGTTVELWLPTAGAGVG